METQDWIDQDPQTNDTPNEINQRVHHHARLEHANNNLPAGTVTTLCGVQIKPRPEAKNYPCCPLCGLLMSKPCT
ncbi:MAG: hypothetical protein CL431_10185 [Acidimicrobiaceae bacterium]|jgi:hypothetical protein|nr:hypothetical protein [Acidimicrobiaceae bacterium]